MRGAKREEKRMRREKGEEKMGREIYDVCTVSVKANS